MQGRQRGKLGKEPFSCFLPRAQLGVSRLAENVEVLSLYSRINGHLECFRRHFFRSGRLITGESQGNHSGGLDATGSSSMEHL